MRTIFLTLDTKTGEAARPARVESMTGKDAKAEAIMLRAQLLAHGYKADARVSVTNGTRVWIIGYQQGGR